MITRGFSWYKHEYVRLSGQRSSGKFESVNRSGPIVIRQSKQKSHDVIHLKFGQAKISQFIAIDIFGDFRRGPWSHIPCIIKDNNLPERLENPIVRIRTCFCGIPQGGHLELPMLLRLLYNPAQPEVYKFYAFGIQLFRKIIKRIFTVARYAEVVIVKIGWEPSAPILLV